ncbi:hypothetical protein E2C01_006643 [Portunus trituberculatus]|uniref:Uncharacterized protein n=1 Tax=Portunus trituberculatus TaxID=210409 RepID=A0A5B7CYP7_PORTR|nr:hypothetical protein [Portunus trituberculatus]
MTLHLASRAPKSHLWQEQGIAITRQIIQDNTKVIDGSPDNTKIKILEALHIKEDSPKLNILAVDLQALPSMRRSRQTSLTESEGDENCTEPAKQHCRSSRLASAVTGRIKAAQKASLGNTANKIVWQHHHLHNVVCRPVSVKGILH